MTPPTKAVQALLINFSAHGSSISQKLSIPSSPIPLLLEL